MAILENIDVWKKALQLAKNIYELCRSNEQLRKDFDLRSQMQRSAVSISSNIAEGNDTDTDKEYLRFLYIARGSCSEPKTQLYITENALLPEEFKLIMGDVIEIHKMINGLIKGIRHRSFSL